MFGQFIVNGFITGILYSLLAIGFALVYNTTRVFHIAAAGIYVFAAFMFYLFAATLSVPIVWAAVIAVLLTMGLSLLTDVSVYRPLKQRNASNNVAMIASIGMMTIIVNLIALFFGNETKVVNNILQNTFRFGGIIITTPQFAQLTIGSALIILFLLFVRYTSWGIRLRALSADATLFSALGYNVGSTRTFVFSLSGLFIATASCLSAYDVGMDPHMGMNVLINAMVAMIIGGVGRFGTCVIGGISLGLLQALAVFFFSSNWQNAITFIVLILILFLRPQGIAGYKQRTV